jgi:hypothetical protein
MIRFTHAPARFTHAPTRFAQALKPFELIDLACPAPSRKVINPGMSATMTGHNTCPSMAATFPAEVAVGDLA